MNTLCILSLVVGSLILFLSVPVTSETMDGKEAIFRATDLIGGQSFSQQEDILKSYVAFKSVSSLHEQYGNETRACAEWLVRFNICIVVLNVLVIYVKK